MVILGILTAAGYAHSGQQAAAPHWAPASEQREAGLTLRAEESGPAWGAMAGPILRVTARSVVAAAGVEAGGAPEAGWACWGVSRVQSRERKSEPLPRRPWVTVLGLDTDPRFLELTGSHHLGFPLNPNSLPLRDFGD